MLTEKCPYCGSFNDVDAATCYFCHKDLPDTPGHKKKRGAKPDEKKSIRLPPSMSSASRKSPPGCLIGFVVLLFLIWSTIHIVRQYERKIREKSAALASCTRRKIWSTRCGGVRRKAQ